jgi:hypothetical protein
VPHVRGSNSKCQLANGNEQAAKRQLAQLVIPAKAGIQLHLWCVKQMAASSPAMTASLGVHARA